MVMLGERVFMLSKVNGERFHQGVVADYIENERYRVRLDDLDCDILCNNYELATVNGSIDDAYSALYYFYTTP